MPSKLAGTFLVVSLVTLAILWSVQLTALDLGFYRSSWVAFNVPQDTGMSLDALTETGEALIEFFRGRLETPAIEAEIRGTRKPVYNAVELYHLEDVKILFSGGFKAKDIAVIAAILSALYLALSPTPEGKKTGCAALAKPFILSGVFGGMLCVLAAIPAGLNFGGFWTRLHLLAFTNDFWLLDPNTDWLIKMFPENFFMLAVKRVGITYLVFIALYICLGFFVRYLAAHDSH